VRTLDSCEYTDEEIEELWNAYKTRMNVEDAKPLEKAVRVYCSLLGDNDNIEYVDLSKKRNFKKHKGEHIPDFLLYNYSAKQPELAAIEVKNYNCFRGKGYSISKTNAGIEILDRFCNYPNFKKILVIAHPRWGEDVREYLIENGVHIIELGFFVTEDNWVDACLIVEEEINTLLFPSEIDREPL
jgi:hypothetical protein